MNQKPIHNFFIFNGDLKPNTEFIPSENTGGIYEVLRVVEGVPLFLEEHIGRFYKSAEIAGKTIHFQNTEVETFINSLIEKNKVTDGNILLSCKTNLKAFFISHRYPQSNWYRTGVKCGILNAERNNPNAKVYQTTVRQQADEIIQNEKVYEVLLVDHYGRITEGSRSNVFFVKNRQLLTPPADDVLLGITRQKTIQIAKEAGIPFFEKEIFLNDLNRFDAAFLTGTSPKILPLSKAGNFDLDPKNELVQFITQQFEGLIEVYISKRHPC